jgi:hypothetical protein
MIKYHEQVLNLQMAQALRSGTVILGVGMISDTEQ